MGPRHLRPTGPSVPIISAADGVGSGAGDGTKKKKHRKGKSGGGSGHGGRSGGSDSGGGGGNSGEDNGGAVEEMDQDGSGVGGPSGRVYPADWETKTRNQKSKYWKRRRPSGKGQSGP